LIYLSIHSVTHSLIQLICLFTHSFIHLLPHSLIDSFAHLLLHSFIDSFIHPSIV